MNIDEGKVEATCVKIIRIVSDMDLNVYEQVALYDGLRDATVKSALLAAILGDDADRFFEFIINDETSKAIKEAEEILEEE